jgi:hypothetical protein
MHPSVRIAKKKTMGGWKLLVDFCPDCEAECGASSSGRGRRRSLSRSRNLSIRSLSRGRGNKDDDEDDVYSVGSSHSKHSIRSKSSNRSSSNRRQQQQLGPRKVKNLKIRDQNRVPGRYSGYVDENSRPSGKGTIRYENGMEWTGVWSAGEQCTGSLGGCKSKF